MILQNFAIMRAKGKKPKKPQNHDSQERSSGRYNASRGLSNRKGLGSSLSLSLTRSILFRTFCCYLLTLIFLVETPMNVAVFLIFSS